MKVLTTITDPVYIPKEKYSGYDKFWLRYINDPRDLPFIYLLTAIHILVIPVAVILYTPYSRVGIGGCCISHIFMFRRCILKVASV
jgi:hypothetical protein